ncbi:MAG: acyl-CoA dehydrogenase family protein [Desulfobacteraceae bacterium]|nr:acyl-CoA dehydrogenase family protein [Desulfobacteraceae bacterium]
MDILPYTQTHKDYRERLKDFIAREVTPNADRWEADHQVPREAWEKMGREGFLCPCVSSTYGGMGGDFLYSVICTEEMAKTNQTGLLSLLHSDIVVPYIEAYGSEKQKQKYLPGCISGQTITAVAMTEPGAGSDLASMVCTAEEERGEVVINGAKTFISNGINCDLVILAARNPEVDNPHKAISLYLVEEGTPGFKKGNKLDKMGMHSQDTAELFFTNCRIPHENRLGEKGAGFIMLMQKLQQERLVCSLWALAIAEYTLNYTIDYCKNTHPLGKALSRDQSVQFALAEMATEIKMSRAFVEQIVLDHISQEDVVMETSMAKYKTSQMVHHIAGQCMDLIGSFGGEEDCPISRKWRDSRIMSIFAGTNEIMKGIIAKAMNL